jgi:hypothetical protein
MNQSTVTETKNITDLRYPIGKFDPSGSIPEAMRSDLVQEIAEAPANLRKAVEGLNQQQLGTPYREGGWTVRQVAHHLVDSHLNAYVRFKLALTEDHPTIKPYHENLWAELYDAKNAPVETSLALLEMLHERWVMLLRNFAPPDFKRTFAHPEHGTRDLEYLLRLYSWHGRHHVAQITSLRKRMNW